MKINIFIDNNIIDSKFFAIDIKAKIVYINSCKITIFIEIRLLKLLVVQRSIYLKKTIVISTHAKIVVLIYILNNVLFYFKDFFFELNEIN